MRTETAPQNDTPGRLGTIAKVGGCGLLSSKGAVAFPFFFFPEQYRVIMGKCSLVPRTTVLPTVFRSTPELGKNSESNRLAAPQTRVLLVVGQRVAAAQPPGSLKPASRVEPGELIEQVFEGSHQAYA